MNSTATPMEPHYTAHWGPVQRVLRFGPRIERLSPEFRVLVFAPGSKYLVYATDGMSLPGTADRLELFLLSSYPDAEHEAAEVLAFAAFFHLSEAILGEGHTVNIGRPIISGASCSCALLSLPYLHGPKLEWQDSPRVRCLWMIPITVAERQFKMEHGQEALESRFEEVEFNYLNWFRESVAEPSHP